MPPTRARSGWRGGGSDGIPGGGADSRIPGIVGIGGAVGGTRGTCGIRGAGGAAIGIGGTAAVSSCGRYFSSSGGMRASEVIPEL